MSAIIDFLNEYNIPYVTEGNNVKKGNVNINCPFCHDDPSEHLGIDPESGIYGCWRNSNHRGKDFTRVIRALIQCSFYEAKRILSKDKVLLQDEDLEDYVNNLFEGEKSTEIIGIEELELPKYFTDILPTGIKKPFWNYLKSRGFNNDKKLSNLIKRFNIKCCLSNIEWKMRLIFPVYLHGELVAWQSRSIYKDAKIPYRDLGKEESVIHVKECIYNYDELLEKGGKILYITEGVFDCLKIEYFGIEGVNATCVFTKTLRTSQIYQLKLLGTSFDEVRLLLDEDAWSDAYFDVGEQLNFLPNLRIQQLPKGVNDPGKLKRKQLKKLIME